MDTEPSLALRFPLYCHTKREMEKEQGNNKAAPNRNRSNVHDETGTIEPEADTCPRGKQMETIEGKEMK
jgi:hypothetical protein